MLVLEDDLDFCELLTETMEARGLEALGVTSGPEAIALATRRPFDLLVTDIRMQGMDGLECLSALRKVRPAMRSIVMTGYASEEAPGRAVALGADDYLYKPFQLQDFMAAVRRVLEAPQERESYRARLAAFLSRFRQEARPEWEALRDLAFQTFYTAVRSRKLTELEAQGVWDELERLALSPASPSDLALGYRCSIDRVAALERSRLTPPRKPEQLRFRRLYENVLSGRISPEQLKLAPYLRDGGDELARSLWE